MKLNDFFCGTGGMGLGFKQAGFNIQGAWDFNAHAVESYRANIDPWVKRVDISMMKWWDVYKADVWSFGFPCQDASDAYTDGKGLEGKRTGLFYQIMRLLKETSENAPDSLPKFLVAENVKGIRKWLHIIEAEFNKAGYKFQAKVLNTKDFGLPQSRERYFMVGIREDLPAIFNFPKGGCQVDNRLQDLMDTEIDEKFYIPSERCRTVLSTKLDDTVAREIKVVGLLDIVSHDHSRRVHDPRGISPTLTAVSGGTHHIKVLDRGRVRKLTPTEYGRIQGFPMDTWKLTCSNTQAYKAFGNAVSPAVAKAIALQIKEVI